MSEAIRRSPSDTVALVLAAGHGLRLGLGPKAFLELDGKSLLSIVTNTLARCIERILVGVQADHLDRARAEVGDLAEVWLGGETRYATILSLFQKCTEDIVLIQEVARPFVSRDLLLRVIEAARRYGAAASFVPSSSSIMHLENDFFTEFIPKAQTGLIQTPQAFHRRILERAFSNATTREVDYHPCQLVLQMGVRIKAVLGEETNFKITTPLDWQIAKRALRLT